MPIYVFECSNCKAKIEEIMSKKESENKIVCTECGHYMDKKLTTASVHFKGTGFYVTDYKNKKPKNEPK